jgi:hypothetical protein
LGKTARRGADAPNLGMRDARHLVVVHAGDEIHLLGDVYDLLQRVVGEHVAVGIGDLQRHGDHVGAAEGLLHAVVVDDVLVLGGQQVGEAREHFDLRDVQGQQDGRHQDDREREPLAVHHPVRDGVTTGDAWRRWRHYRTHKRLLLRFSATTGRGPTGSPRTTPRSAPDAR